MEPHRDRERRGRALNVLGRMYQSGDGVPRNLSESSEMFSRGCGTWRHERSIQPWSHVSTRQGG